MARDSPLLMPPHCVVCNDKTSRPVNFLLSCTVCNSSWHHRCHKPPIQDNVLLNIVKTFNQDRKSNPRAALNWTCRPCLNPPILVDDDDDDIIILDHPPAGIHNPLATRPIPPTSNSTKTRPQAPEIQQTSTKVARKTSESRPLTQLSKLSKPVDHPTSLKKSLSTKATGPSRQEKPTATRDGPFLATDSPVPSGPALVQNSFSTGSRLVSGLDHLSIETQEMPNPDPSSIDDDDDAPLEYVTPPPQPPPGSDSRGVGVGSAETLPQKPSLSTSNAIQEVRLLPSWINARYSAPDAELDPWQRTLTARTERIHSNSTAEAGTTPVARTRNKVKARPLEGGKSVERSFFFSAEAWMNQKRVALSF